MATQYGGVVYHRWFVNGAGWAYHPAATGGSPAEQPGLSAVLDSRQLGALACPTPDGVLWGEQISDIHCPDPKAAARNPTILRAVFLPIPPKASEESALLEALRKVDPGAAGPDASLLIPSSLIPKPPARMTSRVVLLVGLILVAAVVATIAVKHFSSENVPDPSPSPGPVVPIENPVSGPPAGSGQTTLPPDRLVKVVAPLRGIPGVDKDGPTEKAIKQYFARYTAPKPEQEVAVPGEHPDIAFARRFPVAPPKPPEGGWTEDALRGELKKLLAKLSPAAPPPSGIDELVKEVELSANYLTWLDREGNRKLQGRGVEQSNGKWTFEFPLDKPARADIREFAYRFLLPENEDPKYLKDKVELAENYLKLLDQWGLGQDGICQMRGIERTAPEKRPELVFHAIIGILKPPDGFDSKRTPAAVAIHAIFSARSDDTPNAKPQERAKRILESLFKPIVFAEFKLAPVRNDRKPVEPNKRWVHPDNKKFDDDRGEYDYYSRFLFH